MDSSILGTYALKTFEIANELLISAGAGILGLGVLIENAIKNCQFVKTALIVSVTASSLFYVIREQRTYIPDRAMVVFITGCDSGLGFSLAQEACEAGFTVLAGCLNLNSKGAKELRRLFGVKIHHIELDVTRPTSIQVAVEVVERFLASDLHYKLWAVINNAGVMVFGEFEWLTENLINRQVAVNILGTMRVTKALSPLLRQHKGRVIIVSSHCAQATLPGLAVYGATKSALSGWADGLRVELKKYGIKVISFIPGSFVMQSNIMERQVEYSYEMYSSFTEEQKQFYGEYFKRYNAYLSMISGPKVVKKIEDPELYNQFHRVLLDVRPKAVYKTEPLRYKMYHLIFKYAPTSVRDYFVMKFINLPGYKKDTQPLLISNS